MSLRVTEDEYNLLQERTGRKAVPVRIGAQPSANKYGNKKTTVDGKVFDSAAEANRYTFLRGRQERGEIRYLQVQVAFPVYIRDVLICEYFADFAYDENGSLIVEDVKGFPTEVYKLKKKMVEAAYNIEIREITDARRKRKCGGTKSSSI